MSGVQEQLEIKFRLHDGSDIGPKMYPSATSVATLKESILAEWPKEKENAPKTVDDLKLINGGKILENSKTLGECKSPLCDFSAGITTMHVVLRPPEKGNGNDKKAQNTPKENKCGCTIL
ncbi:uncharacterized protein A4U43_C08F16810 [Asparagus officinalis]|uniref:membrane-anchored ubiquitin-fold protein 1-like n=1 Tax=Asparagus officinalis TaxID=4686 RepID=UPI00098E3F5A|nr:membrane-anchored ubiquitin-fold protein 1-like [Asparagus officinalis]ONK60311.1 uncharacterized protein A4U43_C08F16810 [Asparagus officinalis]